MAENNPEFEEWKSEVLLALDGLVTDNFKRLYLADTRFDYNKVWGEVSRELHRRYGLTGITPADPDYTLKRQKQRFIASNVELYSEEEFPHELYNSRTYRFVTQHNALPKQKPQKWSSFELEDRLKVARLRKTRNAAAMAYLDQHAANY